MGEDKSKDTKDYKESYSRKFFDNGNLIITDREIRQHKYEGSRKIYIDSVAGVTFVDSSLNRNMAVLMFLIGIMIAVLLRIGKYDNLYLIGPAAVCLLAVSVFFTSEDKVIIQSNASILNITHSIGFKESVADVHKAIDDAIKLSRK